MTAVSMIHAKRVLFLFTYYPSSDKTVWPTVSSQAPSQDGKTRKGLEEFSEPEHVPPPAGSDPSTALYQG